MRLQQSAKQAVAATMRNRLGAIPWTDTASAKPDLLSSAERLSFNGLKLGK